MMALPTFACLDALGSKVVEIAAGSGLWARIMREYGLDVVAIDPNPGEGVMMGDHTALMGFPCRTLLTVWPPDGTDLRDWVHIWGGERFAFCGDPDRVTMPKIKADTNIHLEGGPKGFSAFIAGAVQ